MTFSDLWNFHPGRGSVCDTTIFGNQCAMRMGKALRSNGASLEGLRTCMSYNRRRFKSHDPGHVLSAQDLANKFFQRPNAPGLSAQRFSVFSGSIRSNIGHLKDRNGMIFIENGWGSTDHIDLWRGDGVSGELRGGLRSYFAVGKKIYFWEISQ